MSIKLVLDRLEFSIDSSESKRIKKETKQFLSKLKTNLKKTKIKAEVFIGGSYAKNTMVKGDEYDIDIFVRFSNELDISKLNKILKNISAKKVHGSRDYYQSSNGNMTFEIIPVLKIKRPQDAKNVTDLSYFHVNYVKRKLNRKIIREIQIAKKFCKANGLYGAESYINGFSGYGLECLVIYYKSFEKMIKEILKSKSQIIVDPKKHYKNAKEVLINLNESKIKSPIILIDPTWKERNVLAALSEESFDKFKSVAKKFLTKPSLEFFEKKEFNEDKLKDAAKQKGLEFLGVKMYTNKQEGDIAGTKLKKFSRHFIEELSQYFEVSKSEFVYSRKDYGYLYLIVKSKGDIIRKGPLSEISEAANAFKTHNKNVYEEQGRLFAKIDVKFSAYEFAKGFVRKFDKKIKEMDITQIEILN
jgi:tRNA nucleotidyltransferase (CCA-adding enzyme)